MRQQACRNWKSAAITTYCACGVSAAGDSAPAQPNAREASCSNRCARSFVLPVAPKLTGQGRQVTGLCLRRARRASAAAVGEGDTELRRISALVEAPACSLARDSADSDVPKLHVASHVRGNWARRREAQNAEERRVDRSRARAPTPRSAAAPRCGPALHAPEDGVAGMDVPRTVAGWSYAKQHSRRLARNRDAGRTFTRESDRPGERFDEFPPPPRRTSDQTHIRGDWNVQVPIHRAPRSAPPLARQQSPVLVGALRDQPIELFVEFHPLSRTRSDKHHIRSAASMVALVSSTTRMLAFGSSADDPTPNFDFPRPGLGDRGRASMADANK
ncbi:hypothetical protein AURDEDRAFT_161043 [Auricularia subglabra TFB-10046 SS5]|nr:hypothetical protein AURDEDRAFT_161043 [Auricularia subglabra TFB-10046 SS5]